MAALAYVVQLCCCVASGHTWIHGVLQHVPSYCLNLAAGTHQAAGQTRSNDGFVPL